MVTKFCLVYLGNRHFELLVFLLRITLGKPRLVCNIDGVNTARFTASCFHKMFAAGVSRVFFLSRKLWSTRFTQTFISCKFVVIIGLFPNFKQIRVLMRCSILRKHAQNTHTK